jgi:hypothetical protein
MFDVHARWEREILCQPSAMARECSEVAVAQGFLQRCRQRMTHDL